MDLTFDIIEMAQLFVKQMGSFAETILDFFNTEITIYSNSSVKYILNEAFSILDKATLDKLMPDLKVAVPIWSLMIGGLIIVPLVFNIIKWIFSIIDSINPIG